MKEQQQQQQQQQQLCCYLLYMFFFYWERKNAMPEGRGRGEVTQMGTAADLSKDIAGRRS